MKHKLLLTLGVIIFLMTGCISSLNPLYTEKDIIFKNELIGTWSEAKSKESWTFEKVSENQYSLSHHSDKAAENFKGFLVQLGDYIFLDLYPRDLKSENYLYNMHMLPVHTFSKVSIKGNELILQMLNPEWFEKGITNKSIQVQHTKTSDGKLILTAPTEELQKFMLTYAGSTEAFDEPLKLMKN